MSFEDIMWRICAIAGMLYILGDQLECWLKRKGKI